MSFLLDTDKQSDDYGDYYSMSRVYIPTVSFNASHSAIPVSVPDEVNLNVSYDEYDSHELSVVDGDESQYVIGSVLVIENGEEDGDDANDDVIGGAVVNVYDDDDVSVESDVGAREMSSVEHLSLDVSDVIDVGVVEKVSEPYDNDDDNDNVSLKLLENNWETAIDPTDSKSLLFSGPKINSNVAPDNESEFPPWGDNDTLSALFPEGSGDPIPGQEIESVGENDRPIEGSGEEVISVMTGDSMPTHYTAIIKTFWIARPVLNVYSDDKLVANVQDGMVTNLLQVKDGETVINNAITSDDDKNNQDALFELEKIPDEYVLSSEFGEFAVTDMRAKDDESDYKIPVVRLETDATPLEDQMRFLESVPDLEPQSLDWSQLPLWLCSGFALSNYFFKSK
jgi:hypothetical protein